MMDQGSDQTKALPALGELRAHSAHLRSPLLDRGPGTTAVLSYWPGASLRRV